MSILTRNDGTQFVIQAYRELIKYTKKSTLIQRIQETAAEHQAQYVRLFKRRSGEYESVFSADAGLLLGESVKLFFPQYNNLIFCETIDESSQVLLIVIKDYDVFIDTVIPVEQLKNELLPLIAFQESFHIVIFGNIPLMHEDIQLTENQFNFPAELVASYEKMTEALLPRLPVSERVRLLPLALALKSEHLSQSSLMSQGSLFLIIALLLVGVFVYRIQVAPHKQTIKAAPVVNPYAEYFTALQTPAPDSVLQVLVLLTEKLYQLPGWQALTLSQTNNNFIIKVKSKSGNLQQLQQWSDNNNFSVKLNPDGIYLETKSDLPQRKGLRVIYPLDLTLETVIDNIKNVFTESTINLTQTIPHGASREAKVQVNFQDITPERLFFFKDIFSGLPVVFNSVDFTLNDDSLINGSIYFSVWGK